MLVLEIIALCSTITSFSVATYRLVRDVRSNKYAADYARIYTLNQHDRGTFTEIVIPKRAAVVGHGHGESAAKRSAGSSAAAAYAYALGKTPFFLSMSASDQRAERQGERTMHWAKDFNAESRRAEPTADSVLVMIDVDEHIDDLPKLLHDKFLPAILYTFQPSEAAGTFEDYRYTFNKSNQVVYEVSGGGSYTHEVWDYSPDCVAMRRKIFGLTYAKSYFSIEKRYVDANHQLVLLAPLVKFGLLGSIFSSNVKSVDLQRLRPVNKDFIRLAVAKSLVGEGKYEHLMSLARVDTHNAATIPIKCDDALAATAKLSESKLSPFQVKSMIPGISNEAAVTLVDYHRLKLTTPPARVVIPTDAVNNYSYNPVFTMDEKPCVSPFMAPILPDTYAPTMCVENDRAMVKGRITDLLKPPKPLEERELRYAKEFAALLKDEIGILQPVGHEEIVEKLNRPAQRRTTDEASFAAAVDTTIKSFMKKEPYGKPAFPRPIATINGKDKYEYSSFTYAVSEALKKTSWYAFGRKPVGISDRVSDICMAAMHVILTDLSKFDGRVNLSLRQVEEIVMKALFEEKHWDVMTKLMRRQYGGKGITRLGVKYKNGYNRQSGSPETAIFNTIVNAFMAYVAFREAGCEPAEAYKKLGIYGGDDGVTPDVDAKLYTETAAKFGHVLEADTIQKGKKGVSFLARMYSPDVWYGDNNTCADIARALSRFHVTTTCDVKPVDKLFEKAWALFLTDAETPIIGDFVSRAVDLSGKTAADFKNVLNIWGAEHDEESQYPNNNVGYWMNELIVDQKLDGFKLTEFRIWLQDCKSMDDLLKCPAFIEHPDVKLADVAIKVNDDLLPSESEFEAAMRKYLDRKKGDAPSNKPSNSPQTSKPDASVPIAPQHQSQPTKSTTNPNSTARANVMAPTVVAQTNKPSTNGTVVSSGSGRPVDVGQRLGGGGGNKSKQHYRRLPRGTRDHGKIGDKQHESVCSNAGDRSGVGSSVLFGDLPTSSPPPINAVNGNNLGNGGLTVIRPAPIKDLTTEGIEPHPGPLSMGAPVMRPPTLDEAGHVVGDIIESIRPHAPNWVTSKRDPTELLSEWAGGIVSPVVDAVHYVTDPIVDYFSDQPRKERLVGVETNPGPVVIPVKGKGGRVVSKTELLRKLAIAKARIKNMPKRNVARAPPRPNNGAAAAAYSSGITTARPIIIHNSDDTVTIKHRELLATVTGSVGFAVKTYSMQPGLKSVFRWLNTQSTGWEKHQWIKLRAAYYTRTGTSTPGTVMLVPDYDAADPAPTSLEDASTYHGVSDDAPWKNSATNFDMKRSRELFLRGGPLAANLDIKTYDFANLHICTGDGTAVSWGKVYLEYEVNLINSQVVSNSDTTGGQIVGLSGFSAANPLGTSNTIHPGAYISACDGNAITLTNLSIGAVYIVHLRVTGTVLTTAATVNVSGFTVKNTINNNAIEAGATSLCDVATYVATSDTGVLGSSATGATFTGGFLSFAPTTSVGL